MRLLSTIRRLRTFRFASLCGPPPQRSLRLRRDPCGLCARLHALTQRRGAHRFAWLNVAAAMGFVGGPGLARVVMLVTGNEISVPGGTSVPSPYPAAAALGITAGFASSAWLSGNLREEAPTPQIALSPAAMHALPRLLVIGFVAAFAVGSFEVGLSLGVVNASGPSPSAVGFMLGECSLVMFMTQTIVFSSLIPLESTRRLVFLCLFILAAGLVILPHVSSTVPMVATVAVIAASARTLSPLAIHWISLGAANRHGSRFPGSRRQP